MPEKQPIDCLFVTGMHRSGISALAECLDLLGVNLGQSNLGADTGETVGLNDVAMIHDILLRDLGCKWNMVGALPNNWIESQAATNARERIQKLIETSFSNNGLWAIADPRLCRLMPLWLPILKEKGLNPGFILTIRHPWEVAISLEKSSGIDLQQGHLLWLALNKEAFDFCQRWPYTVTTYDQLLADPAAILNDIEVQFDLAFPVPMQKQIHRILDTVRPEHKHHHVSSFHKAGKDHNTFTPFAWLYEQISNHRAALKLLAHECLAEADMDKITREDLPTRFYPTPFPVFDRNMTVQKESSHQGNKLFHHFLTLIGQYERDQRELELQKMHRILSSTRVSETLVARLHLPSSEKKADPHNFSSDYLLAKNEWQQIHFPIPKPDQLRTTGLGLAPLNTRGVVSISAMSLVNSATEKVCWHSATPEDFNSIQLENAIRLPGKEALVMMTTANDATLTLPALPKLPDVPMELQAWIKVDTSQEMVASAWQSLQQQKGRFKKKLDEALAEQDAIKTRLNEKDRQFADKNQELTAAFKANQVSQAELQEKIKATTDQLAQRQTQIAEFENQAVATKKASTAYQSRIAELEKTVAVVRKEKDAIAQQFADKTAALAEKSKEADAKQEQVQQLTGELAQRQTQIGEFENQAVAIKEASTAHQSRIAELEKMVAVVRKEKDAIAQQVADKTAALAEKRKEADAKQEQVQQLAGELAQRQSRISELEKAATQELHKRNQRIAELEKAVVVIRQAKEQLEKQVSESTAQAAKRQNRIAELETATDVLSREKESAAGQVDMLVSKLKGREEWIDTVEQELDLGLVQHETMRQEADATHRKIEEYQERIDALEKAVKGTGTEKAQLEKQLSRASGEMAQQKSRISKLVKELERVQYDLRERNAGVEQLQQALDSQKAEAQTLNATLAEKSDALKAANAEKTTLSQRLAQRDTAWKADEKAIARLEQMVKDRERELGDAKGSVSSRFEELAILTKLLEEREGQLAEKTNQAGGQRDQVKQLTAELAEKSKQAGTQAELIKLLTIELAEKGKQADAQAGRVKQLATELEAKADALKTANDEKTTLTHQLAQGEATLKAKEIAIEAQCRRVARLKATASWKMTAPVRALAEPFRKKSKRDDPIEEQIELIKQSDLFDEAWYLEQYPDVPAKDLDLAEHYYHHGAPEGRDPGPGFDTTWYIETYPDVVETGINPLAHYMKYGKKEGRSHNLKDSIEEKVSLIKQSDLFDVAWYLEQNPDVGEKGFDPGEHFYLFGASEGRDPGPKFDTKWYMETYPDVAEMGINPLVHYITFGEKEGRECRGDKQTNIEHQTSNIA